MAVKMTEEEASVIAVTQAEEITPNLSAKETAFYVAGFQECVKYLREAEYKECLNKAV